jgi:hypothetical protein
MAARLTSAALKRSRNSRTRPRTPTIWLTFKESDAAGIVCPTSELYAGLVTEMNIPAQLMVECFQMAMTPHYKVRIGNVRRPLEERLWPRILKTDTCWLWQGARDGHGYGTIGSGGANAPNLKVHVVVYKLLKGDYPEGLELHHKCEVKTCCNPEHLEPLTRKQHIAATKYPRATHCKKGHEFSEENTYTWRGMRCCRACNLIYTRLRRKVDVEPIRHPQRCWKCGHNWIARIPHPKQCANAKCKVRQNHSYGPTMEKPCPPKPKNH